MGKNTQARMLCERLNAAGERTHGFTSPDYETRTGELISRYLRDKVCMVDTCDMRQDAGSLSVEDAVVFQSLMIANRYEVAAKIRGILEMGESVVCVRWWPSTLLYGEVDGLDPEQFMGACSFLPEPDLYVLLDAEVERVVGLLESDKKYESKIEVQARLAAAYRRLWTRRLGEIAYRRGAAVGQRSGRWAVVAADSSPQVISDRVWGVVQEMKPHMEKPGGAGS